MQDSISRQAAIAVADLSDYVGLSVEDVKKVTDEVVKGLKRLPSVQSEIIRCKDCKYRPKIAEGYDVSDYTNSGFALDFPNDFKCPCRCEDPYYSWMPADNWFCANGAKKED